MSVAQRIAPIGIASLKELPKDFQTSDALTLRFDEFLLDSRTRRLSRGQADIRLSPKAFDLLRLLLTRRLRRDGNELPVILMAQAPDMALVAAARDAGVNEMVVKPLSMEGLVLRLMHVLKAPRGFIRSPGYLGPDRRRLPERRRIERRLQGPIALMPDRRQKVGRRSGEDRRQLKKAS